MTLSVWRIATESPMYHANDLSGAGAKLSGGRWNEAGTTMVYASGSIALACLETLVHLQQDGLPLNRYVVRIGIPDSVFKAREVFSSIPKIEQGGWNSQPAGRRSVDYGTRWARENRTAVLEVPSVVVPYESNFLLNPLHKDFNGIIAETLDRFGYDFRLKA